MAGGRERVMIDAGKVAKWSDDPAWVHGPIREALAMIREQVEGAS